MQILTLDFETYFADDYTLSKMTTESYVRDPRFEAHGVGVRFPEGVVMWIAQPERKALADLYDWENTAVLCHHAAFDLLILSHHFSVVPARIYDTYSMAQMLYGPEQSKSLGALAHRFGLAPKNVPYDKFKGRHWNELDKTTQREIADGCLHDVSLTYRIFLEMMKEFPPSELPIIDITCRMFTESRLEGDVPLLRKIHNEEILSKNERLYALGVGERDLSSADKFAAILEADGVEVQYKPGKLKPIPALAKTDAFMQELLDHESERIRELAQARMDVKSTITETRSARLGAMAERGRLCVYLHYCGAHTRRWSGGDQLNFQNLGRRSELRRALRAPAGYVFAAPDQSQGECRALNWLAGQHDVVARFARGEDPYLPIASKFYGRRITKADEAERGTGKQLELSCGFGAGGPSIVATAKRGVYGPPVYLTEEDGLRARDLYRSEHPMVVRLWREGADVLRKLADRESFNWKLFEGRDGRLYHPNGTWLDYSRLKWEDGEWRLYGRGGSWRRMHGPKFAQNLCEFLSRIVTAEAMVKFDRAGYPVVGMAHDDVWLLVPESQPGSLNYHLHDRALESHKKTIVDIMSQTPSWAPGLPLAADCKMGKTYGG